MLHIVLYQPEIPPNTGNVIRLCANTGAHLHLIEPLGFDWDDKRLRRAGLDYHEFADVRRYAALEDFLVQGEIQRLFGFSTKGTRFHHQVEYREGDSLMFGPENRGLPEAIGERLGAERLLRLPMVPDQRSLNLSNSVAIALYQAWGQLGYSGGLEIG